MNKDMIKMNSRNKEHKPLLLVITGIPGSGKSYYANKLVKKHKHTVIIVNRDDIRSMLGIYWVPSRESLVTTLELNMIREGLKAGYDVIVDATNLNPKTKTVLEKIAKDAASEIMYENLIISPKKAYLRILWRALLGGRYISYKVIKGFHKRYFN